MNYPARILILTLFILSTATVSAFVINSFLIMIEAIYSLPRVALYAPGAGIITNLIASSAISDPAAQARFAVSRDFAFIQLAMYTCLLLLSSTFAFSARNPRGFFTVLSCSLFVVVPGIAILKVWAPIYFAERAPNVHWAFLDFQGTALQMGLSLPLYVALFFAGILVLTEEQPRAARAQ